MSFLSSLLSSVGSGLATAGKAVATGASTAGKAVATGASTAAKAVGSTASNLWSNVAGTGGGAANTAAQGSLAGGTPSLVGESMLGTGASTSALAGPSAAGESMAGTGGSVAPASSSIAPAATPSKWSNVFDYLSAKEQDKSPLRKMVERNINIKAGGVPIQQTRIADKNRAVPGVKGKYQTPNAPKLHSDVGVALSMRDVRDASQMAKDWAAAKSREGQIKSEEEYPDYEPEEYDYGIYS